MEAVHELAAHRRPVVDAAAVAVFVGVDPCAVLPSAGSHLFFDGHSRLGERLTTIGIESGFGPAVNSTRT